MSSINLDELKNTVCPRIDALAGGLLDVSHDIHAHPELNYEEHHAHAVLTDFLEAQGIAPERSAYGLATAFDSRVGSDGPQVAVLCEYDALPGVGHACGHNIIAAAGLGAGIAAASVAEQLGGTVRIMGTPAEEGGGGKVRMARAGAFEGVAAAMMVHPADADLLNMNCLAIQQLLVDFHGKAAHAAAAPWEGRNALDAAVLGYMNVSALRQHIKPNERVHGVFTKGGDKPNIVPAEAAMDWYIRSGSLDSLEPLKERVFACLDAAALACGCTMHHEWAGETYADMIDNGPMVASYVTNAARGRSHRARSQLVGSPGVRQHRYGQHQLSGPVDPSDDQGVTRWRAHPQRCVRRVRRRCRGRSRRHRRRQGDGHDGGRPVGLRRVATPGRCGVRRASHWRQGSLGPGASLHVGGSARRMTSCDGVRP